MDPTSLARDNPEENLVGRTGQKRSRRAESEAQEEGEQDTRADVLAQSSPPRKQPRRAVRQDQSRGALTESSSGSRQRGRPRLEAQDQSAAERRRTQIRLAQRAYRQRKESTIADLNTRVTELENVIEEMNKAFAAFDDRMTSSGIPARNPAFARELGRARDRFLELTRSITVEGASEEEEEEISSGATSSRSMRPPQGQERTAHPRLMIPQGPSQATGQFEASSASYQSPFDFSQMPFYQYPSQVAPETAPVQQQSGSQDPTQSNIGEEFQDPELSEWDPDKPFHQFRVEVPEICPQIYQSFFNAKTSTENSSKPWSGVRPFEARKDLCERIANSKDPEETDQLVRLFVRSFPSATSFKPQEHGNARNSSSTMDSSPHDPTHRPTHQPTHQPTHRPTHRQGRNPHGRGTAAPRSIESRTTSSGSMQSAWSEGVAASAKLEFNAPPGSPASF